MIATPSASCRTSSSRKSRISSLRPSEYSVRASTRHTSRFRWWRGGGDISKSFVSFRRSGSALGASGSKANSRQDKFRVLQLKRMSYAEVGQIKALPSFWCRRCSGFRIGAPQSLITVPTPRLSSIQRVLAAKWHGAYSFLTCTAIPQGHIQIVFAIFASMTAVRKNTNMSGGKQ